MALTNLRRIALVVATLALGLATRSDTARACGPFRYVSISANPVYPADMAAFEAGQPGIVYQTFTRRYLVEAYRILHGLQAKPAPTELATNGGGADQRWAARYEFLTGRDAHRGSPERYDAKTYSSFLNCPDDAFDAASRTSVDRAARYGDSNADVLSWFNAQDTVFSNCSGDVAAAQVPPDAPTSAPAWLKTDRAYQIAAAYFYATNYAEARRRFQAIGADNASPWQGYGNYLAARCLIRQATVPGDASSRIEYGLPITYPETSTAAQLLGRAESELGDVIADPKAHDVVNAARRLKDWVSLRARPIARTHELAARLAREATASEQLYVDYTYLMDGFLGQNVEYPFDTVKSRDRLTESDDLTDWVLTMQGTGDEATSHAIGRWRATNATHWLIAFLWKVPPGHPETAGALDDAAKLRADSPAFPTVAFLRARALINDGRKDEARAVLQSLPTQPSPGFPKDVVNMIDALRLRLARSMSEFLAAAPRRPIGSGMSFAEREFTLDAGAAQPPVFEEDASVIFNQDMPLSRLVEAATSTTLPARLRVRVAGSAWTRAVLLHDDAAGVPAATALAALAPALKTDLDRYLKTADPDARHREGILVILRWPALTNFVPLQDVDPDDPQIKWPWPGLHGLRDENWWCESATPAFLFSGPSFSRVRALSGAEHDGPMAWLTAEERARAASEYQHLRVLDPAPIYLASEAIAWGKARPKDVDAAEALARAVKATHYGCSQIEVGPSSQKAFALLHKLFPDSTWAKQTPFWYNGG